MIITITDPGYDWAPTWIMGIIFVVMVAWTVIATVGNSRKWWDDWVPGLSWTVTIVFGIFGFFIFGFSYPEDTYHEEVKIAKVEALEELGFDKVDLYGDQFKADLDGQYFEGLLVETDPFTFRVNEIVEVDG